MSHKETAFRIGHLEAGEPPKSNLPKLVELARQAFEQKRKRDCLDLTRAILLIDPENAAAHSMRSSIQSEMQRDLEDSRALLRQAQSGENADSQLQTPVEPPSPKTGLPSSAAAVRKRTPQVRLWTRAGILVALGIVVASSPWFRTRSNRVVAPQQILSAPVSPNPAPPEPVLVALPGTAPVVLSASEAAEDAPTIRQSPAPGAPVSRAPAVIPEPQVIATRTGILAVSSPTSVDIYKNGAYIGSAPVSLELPVGLNTLEYRHGSLRRSVTHVIDSNDTSRAMITFDVNVQINSKPWANVFIDGVEKAAIGQTPLGGVRVPIGSVLIFENPQFQPKRYRVTGNETGIQIVFP